MQGAGDLTATWSFDPFLHYHLHIWNPALDQGQKTKDFFGGGGAAEGAGEMGQLYGLGELLGTQGGVQQCNHTNKTQ